jgi:hypothetical protein
MRRWIIMAPLLVACPSEEAGGIPEEMLDPQSCKECHPVHFEQWQGSMHAYAADDPIFLAMNAKGQRETGGTLGDFCVRCHAPMAVALGLTTDGLNLGELPQASKGVTCYFCHNVASVDGTHNNPLTLAMDAVMRGSIADPVANDFHDAEYSPIMDDLVLAAGDMCGSCHDIVNGHGVELERTYQEWAGSFYSTPDPADPALVDSPLALTCSGCHMRGTSNTPIADYPGVLQRTRRDHAFVGVDVALTDFPNAEEAPALEAAQLEGMETQRKPSVCLGLCVNPADGGGTDIDVWLHNEAAGHFWPSGAAQDRRAWVELEAFDGDVAVLTTGKVATDASVDVAAAADPTMWVFRDYAYGADGQPAKMFWEITSIESNLLPVAADAGLIYDKTTWRERTWHVDGEVDRVSVQLNLRPIPFELVDELASEEMFDPAAIKARIPTFTLAPTQIEWTPESAEMTDFEGMCIESANCFDVIANDIGI